jgi:hypothetical protein
MHRLEANSLQTALKRSTYPKADKAQLEVELNSAKNLNFALAEEPFLCNIAAHVARRAVAPESAVGGRTGTLPDAANGGAQARERDSYPAGAAQT